MHRVTSKQLAVVQQRRDENIVSFNDRVWVLIEKTIRVTDNDEVNKALREEADRRALDAFVRGLSGYVGEQTRETLPLQQPTESFWADGGKRNRALQNHHRRVQPAKAGMIRDGGNRRLYTRWNQLQSYPLSAANINLFAKAKESLMFICR
ncbi:hypothetical protein J6590_091549 [Homalodisca vitripennis]|nr:hypothetical protein J6590_091549 [Homalodisca vitripennis]